MAVYNIHGGHNFHVTGASGYINETREDRNVKNTVITKLKTLGHTVYDCTDEDGRTQSQNLVNIVKKCNAHNVDLDISIHFNASNGQGHGTEVLLYGNGNHRIIGQRIVDELAALGFRNRGIKDGSGLYVVRNTKAPAILIEVCFCDNAEDAKIYNLDKVASAIVKGITGKTVQPSTHNATPPTISAETKHERVVEVTTGTLNARSGPGIEYPVIKELYNGNQLAVVARKKVGNSTWLKDCTGFWFNSHYCKDIIYTCIVNEVNRRADMNWNSKVVGVDHKGNSHRIKELRNVDGTMMFRDIAGYCCSAHPKYMKKSLDNCKF